MTARLVVLMAGTGLGLGLLLVLLGLWGVPTPDPVLTPDSAITPDPVDPAQTWWRRLGFDRLPLRFGLAAGGALALLVLTRWPVGVLLAAVAGFLAPTLAGAARRRREEIERIEAVATWAEQLRDTIGAAAGLQEAIAVTSRVAPVEIRPLVRELAIGMRRNDLVSELRRFAAAMDDATADQVVVALILASERRGRHLTELLSDVATSAREEATMRIRTETSRAQTYADAKVVSGVVVGMFTFMLLFNRGYLDAYDEAWGQFVLAIVGCLWAAALYGIAQLSTVRRPPRLLGGEG